MTGKADFTAEEWDTILEAPPAAGLVVIAADRGGSVRESFSMAKVYAEARKTHGESELLDDIVGTKPEIDHTRAHSMEELREHSLTIIGDAIALVDAKATSEEATEYRAFILTLANAVANARREGFLGLSGDRVSEAEQAALDAIADVTQRAA